MLLTPLFKHGQGQQRESRSVYCASCLLCIMGPVLLLKSLLQFDRNLSFQSMEGLHPICCCIVLPG